jgi:histone-binding protein RBBP4
MPQNPDLIAIQAISGEVLVFDRTEHPSEPERGGVRKPDIRLVGQTKEGSVLRLLPPLLISLLTGSGVLTMDIKGSIWTGMESE